MVKRTWLGAAAEWGMMVLVVASMATACVVVPQVHEDWVKAPLDSDSNLPTGKSLDWWTAKADAPSQL